MVTEIKAPAGYEMDAPSQTVRLTMGDTQTLTFYDTPQNTLNIVKKDSSTGKNLAGATFYITNSYGEVADTASGLVGSNGYYTTDETGMITLTGLETGTYVVRETKAPDGYILDEAPQTIAVDGGGTTPSPSTMTPRALSSLRSATSSPTSPSTARPSGSRPPTAPSWPRAAAPPAPTASTPLTGTVKSSSTASSPAPTS